MSKVLTTEQREQAGSDSYNRFEYQVHWIVCHIIVRLQEDAECIVFCEFHDDMAEYSPDNQQYQFFQIKTKEDSSDWTIAEMSKREKKKTGGYKKSFLGFIFYNYLVFGVECSHCYFVSNNDFDNDVLLWQAYVEDGKSLQTENVELYRKIKDRIKEEFSDDMPSNFDLVFEEFIQNTFVHKSELQLTTYETQTMGKFFKHLADKNIPSNTANFIFQQLLNDVRKKSKEKIKMPIRIKVKKLHGEIAEFKKKRNLEYNRKEKLESLVQELKSLNHEIEQGNVICAKCGSDKIIYKSKGMSFEVSNSYVRKRVLSSIAYQISQKEEIIREYSYQIQQLQDELKSTLQDVPVELQKILLFSEMILSEIDYDNKLKELCEQLEELQANDKSISDSEKQAKQKCKEMKQDIVSRMNKLYREVDPQGRTFFDDIFTKRDETYSGSEEQEYYYSRILAINDYFNHSYPLLIDCYRSGEISSQKEDIMIKNFISRDKQIIITSTLKKEEYTANKYDQYKDNANVIDYSNNESSKLLQSQYVARLEMIVESFGVMFNEE